MLQALSYVKAKTDRLEILLNNYFPFHTEAARLFGATEDEIQEAVHYAKMSIGWSAYLNGIRADYDRFTEELDQIIDHVKEQEEVPAE